MHLVTLGSVALHHADQNESLLPVGKPLALLSYLACQDGGRIPRDHLTDLLWAHLAPDRGLHSLRQTLHTLRSVLGAEAFDTTADAIRLAKPITTDRGAFLAAIAASDYQQALDQYHGPFLDGVAVPGGARFEEWAAHERDRLHGQWLMAAEVCIQTHLRSGATDAALALAESVRAVEPSRQFIWRLVIESHAQAGNVRGARIEAEALHRLLADTNAPAEPATIALLDRISGDDGAARPPEQVDPLADPELVGRDEVFATLLGAWQRSRSRRVELIHLHGDAGIGKTRLLAAIADRMRAVGGEVLAMRAVPGERLLSYGLLSAMIRELVGQPGALAIHPASAATLVALVPTAGSIYRSVDARRERDLEPRLIGAALTDLLHAIAEEQPIALLIDDLHWADAASLTALGAAMGRVEHVPLLLVTASRHPAALPGSYSTALPVAPLDPAMTVHLVSAIGDAPDAVASWLGDALHRSSRGNPLLVLEALRTVIGSGALALRAGRWEVVDRDAVEEQLRERTPLITRIRHHGESERQVMELLAVAGHPVPAPVLGRIVAGNRGHAEALETLEIAGLIRSSPLGWEIHHDPFAEAVLSDLTHPQVADLHDQLSRALMAQTPSDERLLIQALMHAVASGRSDQLADLGRRWLGLASDDRWYDSPRRTLQRFATMAGALPALPGLLRGVPVRRRPTVRLGLAAAAAVLGLLALRTLLPSHPSYQLVLASTPALDRHERQGERPWRFAMPISYRAIGAGGQTDSTARGVVRLTASSRRATVVGRTTAPLVNGQAVFDSLAVIPHGDSAITFRAETDQLGVIGTITLRLRGPARLSLHIRDGLLNGHTIDPADPVLHVAPGDSISGMVTVSYRSDWDRANVPLCLVTSWLPREQGYWHVVPLRTPVREATVEAPIQVPGPTTPGDYNMILVFRAEDSCLWIASQTNWTMKVPSWHDGNDIVDLTAADLRAVRERGVIARIMPQPDSVGPVDYGIQNIRVEVR